ncbi:MAG TPA: hypothetical protein VNM24_03865 [Burkholderiales bacterium]|jgi:hypothetical protein|nr:hypothetical protein [Burkholderiales bacterium]
MSCESKRHMRSCILILYLSSLALTGAAWSSGAHASGKPAAAASRQEFALYALSRGKGVPAPTRDAFKKAQALLEGARQRGEVVALKETRIGLEGETRLCVEARNPAASRRLQREVRQIGKDVELFNVVEEACSKK